MPPGLPDWGRDWGRSGRAVPALSPRLCRSRVRAPGALPRAQLSPPLPGADPAGRRGRFKQTVSENHKCLASAEGVGTPRSVREGVRAELWPRQAQINYFCGAGGGPAAVTGPAALRAAGNGLERSKKRRNVVFRCSFFVVLFRFFLFRFVRFSFNSFICIFFIFLNSTFEALFSLLFCSLRRSGLASASLPAVPGGS